MSSRVLLVACICMCLLAGCGREAPLVYPGSIAVTSEPTGAGILLDGNDTGRVTPFTFDEIVPGRHLVQVARDGWSVHPGHSEIVVVGRRTAVAHFALAERTGSISVTSDPAGAGVLLDDVATGDITPAVLAGIVPGDYTISVVMDDHDSDPAAHEVTVVADETATADFTLVERQQAPTRIVLLEGFSNVDCGGCPELAAGVDALLGMEGYGPDRALYIKYSMNWPYPLDPHYLANPADNMARAVYYQFASIPVLYVAGTGLAAPTTQFAAIKAGVDAALAEEGDPGFAIAVAADTESSPVPVTITLTGVRDIDLTGCSLAVALVENPVVHAEPPGHSYDETTFHHVMRDMDYEVTLPAGLVAGTPVELQADLQPPADAVAANLRVIAFIQNDQTKYVLQAGSTVVSAPKTDRFAHSAREGIRR